MITFHPTITYATYKKTRKGSTEPLEAILRKRFPNMTPVLVDSGRSGLALIIEELGLSGKRIIVPSFICNVLLPVFRKYEVTPVFIDIDETTYQPPLEAYTPDLLASCDAALVVRTFGSDTPDGLLETLHQHNLFVIEDYAHVPLPHTPETSRADARYYSLSKTLPVPHGGIALLKTVQRKVFPSYAPGVYSAKNWLKQFAFWNKFITRIRLFLNSSSKSVPPWSEICALPTAIQKRTAWFLTHRAVDPQLPYTYCYPLVSQRPRKLQKKLLRQGIVAERIWHNPIALDKKHCPTTARVAQRILCAPLWHIHSQKAYDAYVQRLKETLADNLR